ncbi:hypothetical protein PPACK8108_LOCUS19404 [Phakopsora pachyrhizi]|uniref:Uncharacterized protein n=1 Tax=Phakopsora pachyrhizi TaxID=170000 RepID=A0AAV0BGD4_PHAPC|nr:hypothetical protein PPACK8108_LOCUS19404 [Phakopsora pachyrhizi]
MTVLVDEQRSDLWSEVSRESVSGWSSCELDYDLSRWEPEDIECLNLHETSKKITKSDIGPPPSPHSLIDQDFSPITTHSQDWMDVLFGHAVLTLRLTDINNGFFEVRQYAKPCAFCTRNNLVCCEATRSGSKKCEACRVVWCNPTTKSYGFEHPINEVPTDNFDSGIRSVLKKAGISTGGIPILSKGWVNHKGVESNQVGSSERLARSQLRRAQEAKATQHAKCQKANPVTSAEATWATLNAVAIGRSSKEDGDDDDDDEDGCINRRGNTAETEDNEYRPPIEVPNPPQGKSTIPTAGKYPAHQSTSLLLVPKSHPPKSTLPRVVARRPSTTSVTPGVDDLEPWVPEGSKLQSEGFTHDRRELIRGNPTKRFMELAAVSDQMELEMTEMIKEMGSWLEHLELNGMVPYEAWNGSKGKGRDEGDPEE